PPATTVPPGPTAVRVVPQTDAISDGPIQFDASTATAEGNGVVVRWWAGPAPCFVLVDATVDETPTTVTVHLLGGHTAGSEGKVCTEQAVYYEVLVPLAAPLGSRTVIAG